MEIEVSRLTKRAFKAWIITTTYRVWGGDLMVLGEQSLARNIRRRYEYVPYKCIYDQTDCEKE